MLLLRGQTLESVPNFIKETYNISIMKMAKMKYGDIGENEFEFMKFRL